MSKRRLLHHRTLVHEVTLWAGACFAVGLPLVALTAYSRGIQLDTIDWKKFVILGVFIGVARGGVRWIKNKS